MPSNPNPVRRRCTADKCPASIPLGHARCIACAQALADQRAELVATARQPLLRRPRRSVAA